MPTSVSVSHQQQQQQQNVSAPIAVPSTASYYTANLAGAPTDVGHAILGLVSGEI
jgi:hypothetical protein